MSCAVALPSLTSLLSSRPIDPAQGSAAPPSHIAADADDATDCGRADRWRRDTRPPGDGLAPSARAPHPSGSSAASDDRPIPPQLSRANLNGGGGGALTNPQGLKHRISL
ncbi:hypothetical protein DAEQUDRAFT_764381 [Daedalea quercina L-15889]|uniref:Uncharacterized protein n=1 Tax=Daedalea quercina L-15889 TaxID=1314783 RepID=A0A165RIZ2_9APHY|nr:hypothetical protein DAEQUDRAFT_764381 [Daedalea quercina L-15889]